MAYVTYYTINFHQHLNYELFVEIQRKDGIATTPEVLTATELKINSEADGDGLYSSIIRRNLELVINLTDDDTVTWETFFDQVHDEWKIVITCDDQNIFTGFMLPDEGTVPFEDKPYDLTIRATDCISLLKNVPLKKADGTNFKGKFTLIEYVSACLYWTGLSLPIKIYCDLFHSTMDDRGAGIENDMFAQAKLDHRTFMKDAIEFVSCFEALEIIFKEHFRIFQDYDKETDQQVWEIDRIPQYQFIPANINYYTLYDSDGTNPVGYEDPENFALVGKDNLIYKTNVVTRSGKFAVKKTRHEFKYIQWPEIPLNSKFERGTLIPALSGPDYTAWTIDDWSYGISSGATSFPVFPYNLTATSASRAYTKRIFNVYGVELSRELIMTMNSGNNTWLRSEALPINKGDKFTLSFNQRYTTNFASSSSSAVFGQAAIVYVVSGTTVYRLANNNGERVPEWTTGAGGFIVVDYIGDSTKFSSVSIEAPPLPIDGDLYISLSHASAGLVSGTEVIRTAFEFNYSPYISNGYIPVKGDYWERSQTANYIDQVTEDVKMSDSVPKMIKGCLWRVSGVINVPTSPTWYRYGQSESRHYKELINIGRFNTEYRRFFKFNGIFTSAKYSPENDVQMGQPLSFRKTYKFVDVTEEPQCVLVPPLTIDYKTGWITANFEEVRRESATPIVETLDAFMIRVVAAINSTPADGTGWNSVGGAPGGSPAAYPPIAYLWPSVPNTIAVAINDANTMTATGDLTEIYNADIGPYRFIQYTFGSTIAIGDIYTFTAYGHTVTVTVQATANGSNDGRQMGDSSTFNYLFE
jgi:hypothetical protein